MPSTVLGKVTCVPRGDYSASATYEVLDIAGYQGGSYMALKPVTGIAPSNDGVNWMQLSGPGLPGEQGEQGEPGTPAGFGQATATVDESTGTPSVSVELSGPDTAKVFSFAFSGLKGETGQKGDTGNKGDTGETGPQGVSVVGAEINESGHLIITLSAGEPIDAGNAVGPVGATGETGATGATGASVDHIDRTSGTGAPGTTDTYTVYLTDDSVGGTFNVYNGANGTGSGDFMADGSVPMTGTLQMGDNKIINVGAPEANTDVATKGYVDNAVSDAQITTDAVPTEGSANPVQSGGVYTALAGKQDTLTGTQGQLVGFDAQGKAIAQEAPDTGVTTFNGRTGAVTPQEGDYTAAMVGALAAPDGGTDGQMLYKSADGAVWGDKPVMYVNVTKNGNTGTADKTAVEIIDAVEKGYAVYALLSVTGKTALPFGAGDRVANSAIFATVTTGGCLALQINGAGDANFVEIDFVLLDERGKPNGVAALDSSGKVPAFQLPDMDYVPTSQKGAASGVAELDSTGRVPSTQLPSYVDDVLEYASLSAFPGTGEDGKIYVAEDTNRQYRWSGTQYVEISPSLALGETSSTAYRGDRGKIAYDHSQTTGNPHNTTAADVGARPNTWTPTAADVGAVPTNRTVNGKALSADISLSAADVGARASTWTPSASEVGAATPSDVNAVKPLLRTATLTTAGWSGNSQTVSVQGVVADKNAQEIKVTPDPEDDTSWEQWGTAGVRCKSQGANSLTFVCTESVPTANISVQISIQEART